MKLLVTGAAGRLGRPLTERFARDHEIVAYDRADPPEMLPDTVRYVQGDPPADTTPLINCAKLKHVLNFTPTITWQQGM